MSDDGGYREWQMQQVIDSLTVVVENLLAEIEELRKEVRNPHRHSISGEDYIFVLHDEWKSLRAEVDRLRERNK